MRKILRALVDTDSLFEMGRKFGGSVITALARLDGWPVAVLASDPYFYGGGWTADASQKVARFIDLANTFHLPVAPLVDVPGFVIGVESEKAGTIRQGARALAAIYQARVPFCSVIIRKVFGVAGAGHTPHQRLHYRYAWPPATGDRCRSKAASRRRTAPNWTPHRTARSGVPKSRSGSTAIARRSGPPRPFWSRRSSTRAIRGPCCASSPIWRPSCASLGRSRRRCGRSGFRLPRSPSGQYPSCTHSLLAKPFSTDGLSAACAMLTC
jgi:hypothetical protein